MLFFAAFTGFCCKRHFYWRITNASLRRFCRLFVPCLWIEIYWPDIYAADAYTYRDDCHNLYKRQCTFLRFVTILWRLENDTLVMRLTLNWRELTHRVLVESRAFVQNFFITDRAQKASNPIWIISNDIFTFQLAQFKLEILEAVLVKSN